ncbi:MAG: TA system VapC family ribonuclease toxin [Hyphomicrobiaceae bacterium]
MKLLDANVLLYAYNSDSPHHEVCRVWLERAFNGTEPIALPWQTVLAFIRIATNPRATSRPLSIEQACNIVSRWLEQPNVAVVTPTEQYWQVLQDILVEAHVSGPLVTDAALAALALEQGATLCSTDRDFRRFRGLKMFDPLERREQRPS